MAREFRKVGVVGLGTMGAGIAEVLARSGIEVVGVEPDQKDVERGRARLEGSTARAVKRGKLDEATAQQVLGRVSTSTTELTALADCDLVVEAVPEHLEHQEAAVRRARPPAAPTTPCWPPTPPPCRSPTWRPPPAVPSRVVGLHWFNPAPVMDLVEVVRTVVTDPSVVEDIEALVAKVGKSDVTVSDRAGFIANALLFGYLNNAVRMYEARYASREDIDAAMRFGCGHPMGPLALLDLIGLDSAYEILETMYRQSRDHRHAPAPLLKQYVTAGLLGRKSGRGIYTYAAPGSPEVVPDADTAPAAAPRRRAPSPASASSAPARWPAGSSRSAPAAATTSSFRARGEDKVAGVRSRVEALAGQGGAARQAHRGGPRRRRSAGCAAPPSWTTSPTATS